MYLADDLIDAVVRYAHVPISQVTFQDTDILALADDSIKAKLVPLILKNMAEYYVYTQSTTILANTSTYAIPSRAINQILRSVQLQSSTNPDQRKNLEMLNREDLYTALTGNTQVLVQKSGFYIQGNNVILYPTPPSQNLDTLNLDYFIRPNQLVLTTSCGLITSIDTNANTITCSSVPAAWDTTYTFDLVKADPGFDCTAIDQAVTNISSSTLTFSSTLPSNVAVGDYVCEATQSCVVQVPPELHPLLYQYVVIRVLSAQGDQNGLKAALAELQALEQNASLLLAPRVQGSNKRVVNSRPISRLV